MSRRIPLVIAAATLFCAGKAFVAGDTRTQTKKTPAPTVVYIVRHAEKTGEQRDADLSATGRVRAEVLAWMLRDVHLDAVLSTDVPRTLSTVKPTATAKGLVVSKYKPKTGELTRRIRNEYGGKTVLVCGHSNTIPNVLKELGVGIEEDILGGYDDLFVVVLGTNAGGGNAVITHQRLRYPGRR